MITDINGENLSKLQEIDLQTFKLFLEICKRHNLSYFMLGGSCLGAIRHGGFIPWDDDIDVGLPRGDYEKFIEIAQKELPDGYFLQTSKTDPDYAMNFAKIRNSNTTFIETSSKYININHGAFIDVFPLDGFKDSILFNLKNKIYTLCVEKIFSLPRKQNKIKSAVKKIPAYFIKDYRRARDKKEILMKKNRYEDCEYIANFCGAWGKKEIMPKEYFGNGKEALFEGLSVTVPEKYDLYLTKLYGNYMKAPPPEKRITHHFCEVIDLDKPYTEYINNL